MRLGLGFGSVVDLNDTNDDNNNNNYIIKEYIDVSRYCNYHILSEEIGKLGHYCSKRLYDNRNNNNINNNNNNNNNNSNNINYTMHLRLTMIKMKIQKQQIKL